MTATIAIDPLAAATAVVAVVDPQLRRSVTDALAKTPVQLVDDTWSSGDIDELAASIERLRPSVLFLGLPGLLVDASAAMARMANLAEFAPRVVAVSGNANPEVILKTMRAGAAEFMYPPFEPGFETVLRSVVTAPRSQPDAPAAGKIIGFASVKGGCGATTLACHSAGWLKSAGKKEVLLADLDASAGIAGALMQGEARYTIDDALNNLHRLDLKLWKALVTTSPSGVDVIPAPAEPPAVVPISRKLPPMLRFWRNQYEFTIVDLGSGMTSMLLDVLSSLDTLVLVATNEVPALRQARQMIQNLANRGFGANRVKLAINRMPKRSPFSLPELEKIMGLTIHSVIPNDYRVLSEAYSHPRLIDSNSDLGVQFGIFAAKLAGITPVEKKTRRLFAFK
jgi:pilus assembly protein CpaE